MSNKESVQELRLSKVQQQPRCCRDATNMQQRCSRYEDEVHQLYKQRSRCTTERAAEAQLKRKRDANNAQRRSNRGAVKVPSRIKRSAFAEVLP